MAHSLTYDLYVNDGCVLVVVNLHSHLILSRVAAFCFTDEDDAVTVCVADADMRGVYGLAFLQPGDLGSRFALQTLQRCKYEAQRCYEFQSAGTLVYHKWHNKVHGFSNSASVRLLQVSGDTDLGWL